MIQKTRGIVFRFTKYGETSIIVSIFTEVFGLQSYIVNGVRSKTAKNKIALYQPLTLLELVVYHRPNANLERIREIQCFHPYQSLTSDIKKSTIAIFINELLNKTVKEESHVQDLFEFLVQSMIAIDELTTNTEDAHLIFMIKLSRHLGFGPQFANEIIGGHMTDKGIEENLEKLIFADYGAQVLLSNAQRKTILELMIGFYADHIENFGEMKSLYVLRELFK
jgi:DNA repair protein RecO (recombination protein O)